LLNLAQSAKKFKYKHLFIQNTTINNTGQAVKPVELTRCNTHSPQDCYFYAKTCSASCCLSHEPEFVQDKIIFLTEICAQPTKIAWKKKKYINISWHFHQKNRNPDISNDTPQDFQPSPVSHIWSLHTHAHGTHVCMHLHVYIYMYARAIYFLHLINYQFHTLHSDSYFYQHFNFLIII
jgi:hypothetical protein